MLELICGGFSIFLSGNKMQEALKLSGTFSYKHFPCIVFQQIMIFTFNLPILF